MKLCFGFTHMLPALLHCSLAFVALKSGGSIARRGLVNAIMSASVEAHTLDGKPIGGALLPLSNCILVRVQEKDSVTEGGVILLEKSLERWRNDGTVVALGPGRKHQETGVEMPMPCAVGDKILYGKYDGSALNYDGVDHQFIRDSDVLFVYTGDKMTPETIKMIGDQILVEVEEIEKQTKSGLILANVDAEGERKPTVGRVVAVGPGRVTSAGERLEMNIEVGDIVKFRNFAGSEIKMGLMSPVVYRVMKEEEVLVKW